MVGAPWPAPAKVNLFLHVLGRRPDGYHELQTAFQFLDLVDELSFKLCDHRVVRRVSEVVGVDPQNDLSVRAAVALQEASGASRGVEITVLKRIPLGGGLGGGSSDAATTLLALNELWGLSLCRSELTEIGLGLGADVPVFIYGHAAWAEGIGDRLTAIDPEEAWYLVVHPGCSVSTAQVFSNAQLTRNSSPMKIAYFAGAFGRNDCEAVVRSAYPEVAAALDWLGARGEARLTGTGACVFSRLNSEADARARLASLPASWRGFVARGLNRSPLEQRLAAERMAGGKR